MKHWKSGLRTFALAAVGLLLACTARAQILEFAQADFAFGPAQADAVSGLSWHTVALPDRWRETHPGENGTGWYRLQFERSALDAGIQAVYIPHASVNATVFLNGHEIGRAGADTEPLARTWNHPRLYLLPPAQLLNDSNTVLVRVQGHAYTQASFYPPKLGSEAPLRAEYEQAYFWRITLNQIATLLITAVSLLMLSLWLRRRKDVAYGYLALSAMVWSLQSTNLFVLQPPVDTARWEIFVNASFQIFSALLLLSMLRFVGLHWRPLNLALGLSCFVSPLAMVLVAADHFLQLTAMAHMFTLAATLAVLGMLTWSAVRCANTDARLLLVVLCAIVLFALHDWLLHSQHILPKQLLHWLPGDLYLLQYSAPFIFLAIGWIMTVRFVRVLNEFEALSQELDQRVQAKSAQLEDSFARLKQLERERAAQEERERIHSDLHDDVGAKLLTLVYRAPTPEHAELARAALQELRDVVSSPTAADQALEYALGDWRSECEQRLGSAGVDLQWEQDSQVEQLRLEPQQCVNLGRILREAISNILRHAQASQVQVKLRLEGAVLHLHIVDNGSATAQVLQRQGRGTRNMQARAQAMGGQFERSAGTPSGCHVHVCLPLRHVT
ncbi:MAG: histidine kinase [Rhodoferax sp.]|nr:MAG: histidine kinase [Rhodoferax sp.]